MRECCRRAQTDDECYKIVCDRKGARIRHRHYAPDVELKGVAGERMLHPLFRIPIDTRILPLGDGGIDGYPYLDWGDGVFRLCRVDAKAASTIGNSMLVTVDSVNHEIPPDIYILGHYRYDLVCNPYGWVTREAVLRAPVRLHERFNRLNHVVPIGWVDRDLTLLTRRYSGVHFNPVIGKMVGLRGGCAVCDASAVPPG